MIHPQTTPPPAGDARQPETSRAPEIHVIPIDDQIEHRADCECCTAYPDSYGLWIHHSADKREQYERGGNLGKGWIVVKKDEQTGQLIPV